MTDDLCLLVFLSVGSLLWLTWVGCCHPHRPSQTAAITSRIQRLLKPRTPEDCPACRQQAAVSTRLPPTSPPIIPWCVHAQLQAQGVRTARKRVARLMRQSQLCARPRRRRVRTTDSRHSQPIAPNLLSRTFVAEAPNRVWVCDITYLATREGWLYLAVVLDLFARRVVGWSMQPTLERGLVLAALDHALRRRQPPPGLLHHSDRGSQYASGEYQALLAEAQMRGSMSRRGDCWDNAAMESFFATLKAELPVSVFDSHAAARSAVFDYIERFYNRVRLHSTLAYRSPVAYELQHLEQAAAA